MFRFSNMFKPKKSDDKSSTALVPFVGASKTDHKPNTKSVEVKPVTSLSGLKNIITNRMISKIALMLVTQWVRRNFYLVKILLSVYVGTLKPVLPFPTQKA